MKSNLALCLAAALLAAPPVLAQHDHGGSGATTPTPARPGGRPPAAREWTRQPLLLARPEPGGRAAAVVALRGLEAPALTVYAADGPAERRQVAYPVAGGSARIEAAAPPVGNYHWLVAREETAEAVRVATTAWFFANPGAGPADLLATSRHELEIIPAPLPREHRSYREAEKWRFLVRYQGAPLAGQTVTLETDQGSRSSLVTDAAGYATVVFPRDLKAAAGAGEEGEMPRNRGRFLLTAEKDGADKHYLTTFNYTYGEDPERGRSLAWGAAFGLLGMVAATPLLRRRPAQEGKTDHA